MPDGLPLNDAERGFLEGQGLAERDGVWRSTATGTAYGDGVVVGLLKAMPPVPRDLAVQPGDFQRGPLTAGHQTVTAQGLEGVPQVDRSTARPATPGDFTRGWLNDSHQKPSPDDGVNNPVAPGSDGARLYASAAAAYGANRDKSTDNHVARTGDATSRPAVPQWRPPAGLGAGNVPTPVTVAATKPAPGER